MTMTQRYAGALRRHAHDLDVVAARPVQAEMIRQAAQHIECQQAAINAAFRPWQPMNTAPKDGAAVLVLLEGSNIPYAVRWRSTSDELGVDSEGWFMTWDNHKLSAMDGPRYWMPPPNDPEAQDAIAHICEPR